MSYDDMEEFPCTEVWYAPRGYSTEEGGDYRHAKSWYCPQCYSWFKTKRETVAHLDSGVSQPSQTP